MVIGVSTPPPEINVLEARDLGIELVRGFTGGAIYRDLGNINYVLTLPGYNLSIEESFSVVGLAVVETLGSIGITNMEVLTKVLQH